VPRRDEQQQRRSGQDAQGNSCAAEYNNARLLDREESCPYVAHPNQLDPDTYGQETACDQGERNFHCGPKYQV
jgi:hypothetical protein